MKSFNFRSFKLIAFVPIVLFLASCTAGDTPFTEDNPAGFLFGLWHGIIAVITLIVHVFNDSVAVYEIHNTGGWYDFGFLLGVICIWGGGSHANCKSVKERKREQEWKEIGEKVEKKVMNKLKAWAEDEQDFETTAEWDEVREKAEKKLKRKIREWAEKDNS